MRKLLFLLALLLTAESLAGDVTFRKHYVDGTYGQVHVLTSRPRNKPPK